MSDMRLILTIVLYETIRSLTKRWGTVALARYWVTEIARETKRAQR